MAGRIGGKWREVAGTRNGNTNARDLSAYLSRNLLSHTIINLLAANGSWTELEFKGYSLLRKELNYGKSLQAEKEISKDSSLCEGSSSRSVS